MTANPTPEDLGCVDSPAHSAALDRAYAQGYQRAVFDMQGQLAALKPADAPSYTPLLDRSIKKLAIDVRALNILDREGVKTIRQLANKTEAEVSDYRNMGEGTMRCIIQALAEHGLKFGMSL